MQNSEYRIQNAEFRKIMKKWNFKRMQNSECRIQNAEFRKIMKKWNFKRMQNLENLFLNIIYYESENIR